jgi:hypothetical protein
VPVLHFGVIDLPYRAARGKRAKRTAATVTTGDVAGWLENRYGVMQTFYDAHQDSVVEKMTESVRDAMEALMQGAPATLDPFGAATSEIEGQFKRFLSTREMDKLGVTGVPTQASLEGRSSRFKSKKSGAPRPSFIDTGLYQSSFKAWVDDGSA